MAMLHLVAAAKYRVDGSRPSLLLLLPLAVFLAAATALCFARTSRWGIIAVSAFALAQAAPIHPLQIGLDPLLSSPLRVTTDRVADKAAPGAWVSFGGGPHVKATLTAAGIPNLAGISPFPDRAAWQALDPRGEAEAVWNRYAHLSFFVAPPGAPARLVLEGEDSVLIYVDPCGPELLELEVTVFVSLNSELSGCVRPLDRIPFGGGDVFFYERTAP